MVSSCRPTAEDTSSIWSVVQHGGGRRGHRRPLTPMLCHDYRLLTSSTLVVGLLARTLSSRLRQCGHRSVSPSATTSPDFQPLDIDSPPPPSTKLPLHPPSNFAPAQQRWPLFAVPDAALEPPLCGWPRMQSRPGTRPWSFTRDPSALIPATKRVAQAFSLLNFSVPLCCACVLSSQTLAVALGDSMYTRVRHATRTLLGSHSCLFYPISPLSIAVDIVFGLAKVLTDTRGLIRAPSLFLLLTESTCLLSTFPPNSSLSDSTCFPSRASRV